MPRLTTTRLLPRFALAALAVFALLGLSAAVQACNIPVFRYALERWRPDPYRLTLFHRGPLTAAQQALVKPWEEPSGLALNGALRFVDIDAIEDEADRALFAAQASPQLPWLVVQYPQGLQIAQTVWAGPLVDESLARLIASPLRTELIRRLAAGDTAVWLLLESGDAAADDAAAAQLTAELKQLAGKLKLPELSASPDDQLRIDAPLKVAFSLVRVPRNMPAEQPLVDLLLHIEPDLKDLAKPMVFPVFGRGRALLPLIGAGITPDNIHESAAFLVGACSCEVKELNPGFDLLLAANWDEVLSTPVLPDKALAPGAAVAAPGKPELVAIPPGAPPATTTATINGQRGEAAENNFRGLAFAVLGIGLLCGIMAVVLRR